MYNTDFAPSDFHFSLSFMKEDAWLNFPHLIDHIVLPDCLALFSQTDVPAYDQDGPVYNLITFQESRKIYSFICVLHEYLYVLHSCSHFMTSFSYL